MNSNCSLPVNLGNPEEHSIADFAQIIRDLVGSSSEIIHQPSQPDDPQQRKPDISRAARELNWKPQKNFMSYYFTGSPPPKKRPRADPFASDDDDPDSDDSFNDPVLNEPSQITQAILQRRGVNQVEETSRNSEDFAQPSTSMLSSPLRPPPNDDARTRKPLSRTVTGLTPRRFNAQEKSDYHHNGEVMMLKYRVENLEREKERAATATRDQIIAKEKEHASEITRRDERIRQLESQILALRHENMQTSFQLHNASLSGTVDVEMADTTTTLPPGPVLQTKKVNILRNDVRWKAATRFGCGASVFGAPSSVAGGVENGSETFAHIPSQMLTDTPNFDVPPQPYSTPPVFTKTPTSTENKECQVSNVTEDWNVRSNMRESPLESLLGVALISQERNFELFSLSELCKSSNHLDLKTSLRSKSPVLESLEAC
ncbi:hypothetical protein OESDEN_06829 [Oesophagostomum dentatum]|uniref:Uncharacterized protein n=1 Tax=Oesophagostomum dentatum TaxID=61180 RepID=A0A0B1TAV2_OESDE|nr:hypothetical protein OESDEN_06829 [Oesophagostomum dentatum]